MKYSLPKFQSAEDVVKCTSLATGPNFFLISGSPRYVHRWRGQRARSINLRHRRSREPAFALSNRVRPNRTRSSSDIIMKSAFSLLKNLLDRIHAIAVDSLSHKRSLLLELTFNKTWPSPNPRGRRGARDRPRQCRLRRSTRQPAREPRARRHPWRRRRQPSVQR